MLSQSVFPRMLIAMWGWGKNSFHGQLLLRKAVLSKGKLV